MSTDIAKVLVNFLDTELLYSNVLTVLTEEFAIPCKNWIKIMNYAAANANNPHSIFLVIPVLLNLQLEFFAELKHAILDFTDLNAQLSHVSHAIKTLKKEAFINAYLSYAVAYDHWTEYSSSLVGDKSFTALMLRVRDGVATRRITKKNRAMSLKSLLLSPVEKLAQYRLVLRTLSTAVEDSSVQAEIISVLRSVSATSKRVHWFTLGEAMERETLTDIQQRINDTKGDFPDLLSKERYLLREGILLKAEAPPLYKPHIKLLNLSFGQKHVLKPRRVFLFNDLLLWCSVKSPKPKGALLLHPTDVFLDKTDWIGEDSYGKQAIPLVSFSIITENGTSLQFVAENKRVNEEWVEAIEEALWALKSDSSVSLKRRYDQILHNLQADLSNSEEFKETTLLRQESLETRDRIVAEKKKIDQKIAKESLRQLQKKIDPPSENISAPYNVAKAMSMGSDMIWGGNIREAFTLEEEIGNGAFGKVYKATSVSGFSLAIKLIDLPKEEAETVRREVDILRLLKHKNIVTYFGCYGPDAVDQKLWILMELCHLGSIAHVQHVTSLEFSEIQLAYILRNVIEGLAYLHSKNVVHRDIKGDNIFCGDFGVSKVVKHANSEDWESTIGTELVGSPCWIAPEIINGGKVTSMCDIWSLGITAIELAEGEVPFTSSNVLRILRQISVGEPPKLDRSYWSEEFCDFVGACLVKNPWDRATCETLLQHSFMKRNERMHSALVLGPVIQQFLVEKDSAAEVSEEESLQQTVVKTLRKQATAEVTLERRGSLFVSGESKSDSFGQTMILNDSVEDLGNEFEDVNF